MGLVKTTLLASSFGEVFDLRRIPQQFLYHRAHGKKKGKIRIALFWILLKFGLRNTTGLRK
jgi:hypothetical protein